MPTQRTSEEEQGGGNQPGESTAAEARPGEGGGAARPPAGQEPEPAEAAAKPEASGEEGMSGAPRRGGGRGFAGMDPARQREIASKGGKAAHAKGTAHEFSSEEARAAGRKGGEAGGGANRGFAGMDPAKQREIASKGGKAAHAKGTAHEFTSEEARAAGRKGGEASGSRKNR